LIHINELKTINSILKTTICPGSSYSEAAGVSRFDKELDPWAATS